MLINTKRSFDELHLDEIASQHRAERLLTLPATEIALKHLGRPLPNAVLLGGFAALSGMIQLNAVVQAIGHKFKGVIAERNAAAATEAFQIIEHMTQASSATRQEAS